jgi:hypothetical protein
MSGANIAHDVAFEVAGTTVYLDGFDAALAIGFEFITTAAGDRAEFTPNVLAALDDMVARGVCSLLLVDEAEGLSEAELRRVAEHFLQSARKSGNP